MANQEQLEILKQGVNAWNEWRALNPKAKIDLSSAELAGSNLHQANFKDAYLREANLTNACLVRCNFARADLVQANLRKANLREAHLAAAYLNESHFNEACLSNANLAGADLRKGEFGGVDFATADLTGAFLAKATLTGCDLREANLTGADLAETNLTGADLTGAVLKKASLIKANLHKVNLSKASLTGADLTGAALSGANLTETNLSSSILVKADITDAILLKSRIYGISAWDLEGEFGKQSDLVITPDNASEITVDDIEVAQFIYLILNNKKIRDVLDMLTSKAVLILGRFSNTDRKAILDALKKNLRDYGLLPIIFDFERPTDRDFTETIKTLAGMCYFVIADVTNPKSSPLELQAAVPDYQIPFVPIIQEGEKPFAMMVDLQKKYTWVLNTVTYDSMETLIKILKPLIIDPAMQKRQELRLIKAQEPEVISGKEYLAKRKE